MTNIYEQHDAAFANVSAYIVARNGEKFASIAFKYPRDGAGRLYAYVHWLGVPMVRGFAGGYGYDKHSAAVANAIGKMTMNPDQDPQAESKIAHSAFMRALERDGGEYWNTRLERAGFQVWQAV